MNPLGPIIVTSIIAVTLVCLYGLRIISKVITHFCERDEDI